MYQMLMLSPCFLMPANDCTDCQQQLLQAAMNICVHVGALCKPKSVHVFSASSIQVATSAAYVPHRQLMGLSSWENMVSQHESKPWPAVCRPQTLVWVQAYTKLHQPASFIIPLKLSLVSNAPLSNTAKDRSLYTHDQNWSHHITACI